MRTRIGNQLALQTARKELKRHNDRLEELVAERTQELADAHRRLLTIDSAKYDFLQLIYHELWAPETGIIDLSRKALARLGRSAVEVGWVQEYEKSQASLLETINNALLMAGTHVGDKPAPSHPIRLGVLAGEIQSKFGALAQRKKLGFQSSVDSSHLVSGDLDLLFQALTTVVHSALLMARDGSTIKIDSEERETTVVLAVLVQPENREQGLATLFEPEVAYHPSKIRRELGLAIPLASKILGAQGGTIDLEDRGQAGQVMRVSLPRFRKTKSVRIVL